MAKTIALEIGGSSDRVLEVVGAKGDPRRAQALKLLRTDDRVLIPLYVSAYVATAVMLARRDFGGTRWVGVLAAAAAVVTGVVDLTENRLTKKLLALDAGAKMDDLARRVRRVSLLKWLAAFVTAALVAVPLLAAGGLWELLVGAALLYAAFAGLLALVVNLRQWAPEMIGLAFLLTGLAVGGALAAAILLEVNA